MKKLAVFIYLLSFLSVFVCYHEGAIAQDQPKKEEAAPAPPPPPPLPERAYELPFDAVWDKIIEALKEKGLYSHPHGKTVEDKENGKITTQTFRYFSIIQAANPVIELDYSDQYIITVIKPPEPKKEEPKAAEPAKDAKADAKSASPTPADKKAAASAEKSDKPTEEKSPPEPEVPKGPPVIKVQIQRKFQKHNGLPNPQGAWVAADPKVENNAGISEEALFKTLDLLVASLPKATPATPAPATVPASTTSAAPGGK